MSKYIFKKILYTFFVFLSFITENFKFNTGSFNTYYINFYRKLLIIMVFVCKHNYIVKIKFFEI